VTGSTAHAQGTAGADSWAVLAEAENCYRHGLAATARDQRVTHFLRALLLYERVVAEAPESGQVSAELLVNLGNAALQAERLGVAVHAYRRALVIDPAHRRARQNLEHARTLLPPWVRVEPRASVVDSFFFWHHALTPAERAMRSAWLFLLGAALLALSIRYRRGGLRMLAILPLFAWAALVASLLVDAWGPQDTAAVVVGEEVIARSADAPGAPRAFPDPLPEGSEVKILESRENWRRIALANGRSAWVDAAQLYELSSNDSS
jgi:hypothetical protein